MSQLGRHHLHHGDALDVLRAMPDASVDAVVTDPPYGLGKEPDALAMLRDWLTLGSHVVTGAGFMGRAWDVFVPQPVLWAEVLRVLKPGGHALVFAGTRTQDLMGLALRIAGFEVRDCLQWIYGSGFPKSLDVSKALDKAAGATRVVIGPSPYAGRASATDFGIINDDAWEGGAARNMTAPATPEARQWDGWGTALKPAYEPILLCRKPLAGTVAQNVLAHGTGGLNIDACRVGSFTNTQPSGVDRRNATLAAAGYRPNAYQMGAKEPCGAEGRWPANIVLNEVAAELLDAQTGERPVSGSAKNGRPATAKNTGTGSTRIMAGTSGNGALHNDSGGASRFFYCAKASTSERGPANRHPTVKPLALMRWLCQLVTPPGGVILDPFAGSGTTLLAADALGFTCIAVEREAEHVAIIMDRYRAVAPLFVEAA